MSDECILCGEPIADGEDVLPTSVGYVTDTDDVGFRDGRVHAECMVRSACGGIGHHEDHDYWCTKLHDPDGGRTYRQSALEVAALFAKKRAAPLN